MTRGYMPREGLSGTDELLHRMILDNTHVTRETRDIAMRGLVQNSELRHDLMHLSKQVVGLTYRAWQQEEAVRQLQSAAKPPKSEGLLWALSEAFKGAWALFTPTARVALLLILPLMLFGLVQPMEVKNLIRGWIGLPPSVSTPSPGAGSSGSG